MKHTAATMTRARDLNAADFTYPQIVAILERERGVTVHRTTVAYWCDPEWAARKNARARQRRRRPRNLIGRMPARVVHRMIALRRAGLSNAATARVLNLDERTDTYTAEKVRYYVAAYGPPKMARGSGQLSRDQSANWPVPQRLKAAA